MKNKIFSMFVIAAITTSCDSYKKSGINDTINSKKLDTTNVTFEVFKIDTTSKNYDLNNDTLKK